MALTSHGHHIPGSGEDLVPPASVARCGGPGLCITCRKDCGKYREPEVEQIVTEEPVLVSFPSPYVNIQQCLKCHVLLSNKAVRCPICEPKE